MDEVVDLRAGADHRVVDAPPIDRGVRADLDIISNDASPDVRNFHMLPVPMHVAEPIRRDPGSGVDDDALAEHRPGIDGGARVDMRMCADLRSRIHGHVRVERHAITDLRSFANDGIGSDPDGRSKVCPPPDDRRGADAWLAHRRAIQARDETEEGLMGPLDDDPRVGTSPTRFREVRGDEYHPRPRQFQELGILGRREKAQFGGLGAVERSDAPDDHIGVADDAPSDGLRNSRGGVKETALTADAPIVGVPMPSLTRWGAVLGARHARRTGPGRSEASRLASTTWAVSGAAMVFSLAE